MSAAAKAASPEAATSEVPAAAAAPEQKEEKEEEEEESLAEPWRFLTAVQGQAHPDTAAATTVAGASPGCQRLLSWLMARHIEVVVWDMDHTMGSGHCGTGILHGAAVDAYVAGASRDFVEALGVLSSLPGLKLAVSTASDPLEYDLPGHSRDTHMLGPDLARELIGRCCPEALPRFDLMVGYDPDLHPEDPKLPGKSVAMRRIAAHFGADPSQMVLIDDSPNALQTTDGWYGLLVRGRAGFSFLDCEEG